jgi:hypothetical protein
MDADSDEVIIKRKIRYVAGGLDYVHTAERLINQGLLRNVQYISTGLSK